MAKRFLAGLTICALLFVSGTFGHSYVTSPTSRSNQKQSSTGCRGPACLGPCDAPASKARTPITIARGASINVQWPRNNHAGGFIRFAWAPTTQSDIASTFDANVQEIHCHEIGGCKPDSASNPNGGDSGPADGSSQPCQTTIAVPLYLTDGKWTLQWAWFGGAFELGDYYSCVDYQISGGSSGSQKSAVYYGGDYSYPGQNKCKFFNTDRLHQCVNEPCNNPVYTLSQEKSGPAFGVTAGVASSSSSSSSTTTSTSTTAKSSTSTSTTGKSSTSTTGKSSTSTTGKATQAPTDAPTQAPTDAPVTPSGDCTLGNEQCVGTNTYVSCYRATASSNAWSPARSCQVGLVCKPWLTNHVICDRP